MRDSTVCIYTVVYKVFAPCIFASVSDHHTIFLELDKENPSKMQFF